MTDADCGQRPVRIKPSSTSSPPVSTSRKQKARQSSARREIRTCLDDAPDSLPRLEAPRYQNFEDFRCSSQPHHKIKNGCHFRPGALDPWPRSWPSLPAMPVFRCDESCFMLMRPSCWCFLHGRWSLQRGLSNFEICVLAFTALARCTHDLRRRRPFLDLTHVDRFRSGRIGEDCIGLYGSSLAACGLLHSA